MSIDRLEAKVVALDISKACDRVWNKVCFKSRLISLSIDRGVYRYIRSKNYSS